MALRLGPVFKPIFLTGLSWAKLAVAANVLIATCVFADKAMAETDADSLIGGAVEYYVATWQNLSAVAIVDGALVAVKGHEFYTSKEEFMDKNPNCCRFSLRGRGGYYPSFWHRLISGYVGVVAIESYMLKAGGIDGKPINGVALEFPVNSKGEVIVVHGFNGD